MDLILAEIPINRPGGYLGMCNMIVGGDDMQ